MDITNMIKTIKALKNLSEFASYINNNVSSIEERVTVCFCFMRNQKKNFDTFFKPLLESKQLTGRFTKGNSIDIPLVICKWVFLLENGVYKTPVPNSKGKKQNNLATLYKITSKLIQHFSKMRTLDFFNLIKEKGISKMYKEYLTNRPFIKEIYPLLCKLNDIDTSKLKDDNIFVLVGIKDENGNFCVKYVEKEQNKKNTFLMNSLHNILPH